MTKKNKTDIRFVVALNLEMKQEITAIAYQTVGSGGLSATVRGLISKGIQVYKEGLAPREKTHLAQILENVRIADAVKPPKRTKPGKYTYVKKKLRGGIL